MSSQMSQMSQFEPLDVKFKALLDPIKDLAANWDIDIADSLTDYLEELDGLRMSVDGQSNLNFAAAGLLIQGSTAVYSKKVEFLHQLVQQSLDEITNSRNSSSVGQGKTKGNANSTCLDDERLLFGTDPSFLLLDDAVEEGSNINLDEQTDSLGNAKERRRSSGRHSVSGDFSRASMVLMHSVLQEDHGGSSLRMSSCLMDSSGALVLGAILPEKNVFCDRSLGQQIPSDSTIISIKNNDTFHLGDNDMDNNTWGINDNGDNGDDGDDNDFSVFGDNDQGNLSRLKNGSVIGRNGKSNEVNYRRLIEEDMKEKKLKNVLSLLDPHAVTTGSKPVKKARANKVPKGGSFLSELNKINDTQNNIASIDFFKLNICGDRILPVNGLLHKMFAPQLKQIKREERKLKMTSSGNESGKNRNKEFFLYRDSVEEEKFSNLQGDNDYGNGDDDCSDDDNNDGGEAGCFWDELNTDENGNKNEHENGNNKNHLGDKNDNLMDNINGDTNGELNKNGDSPRGKNEKYLDPFQDVDDDLMRRVELALSDSLSQSEGGSYESICRKHIQNFMSGAEQYARETQLSKRVAEWTNRLEPILRNQELLPEFNIHTYSDLVLTQVGSVTGMELERRFQVLGLQLDENSSGEEKNEFQCRRNSVLKNPTIVDFQEIVGDRIKDGKSSSEVCRVFLACLMLANAGNLDLIPPDKATKSIKFNSKNATTPDRKKREKNYSDKSSFCVRLLKNKRVRDIEEFRAPSFHVDEVC